MIVKQYEERYGLSRMMWSVGRLSMIHWEVKPRGLLGVVEVVLYADGEGAMVRGRLHL